jgi:23S rRNA pseudouridine2605 synthase
MMKNNNRNSRDDKSTPGNRNSSNRRPAGTESTYKGKRTFADKEGKEGGYQGKKPFADKDARADKFSGAGRNSTGRAENTGTYRGASRPEGSNTYKGKRNFEDKEPRTFGDREPREHKFSGAGRPGASRPETGTGYKGKRPFENKEGRDAGESKGRSYIKKDQFGAKGDQPARKFEDRKGGASRTTDNRPFRKRDTEAGEYRPSFSSDRPVMRVRKDQPKKVDDGLIRLNRYIANSGICSRRKADELIAAGVVSVNGVAISELGHKIDPAKDEVRYNGELLKREKKTYVLLNKPKDYITTTDDPQERKTVMQLVEKASRERIYPVGRLDRNTTGLLLMTNDGDLADKLSHPRNGITKIYHVELDKSLSQGDLNKIQFGLELEDGLIKPDNVSYVTGGSKREVGIQIHSGKNRIVRRIFEHLGYEVVKLDRVVYGNLTKKDLPRGRWRYLEEHELIQIKHLIK